MPQCAFKKCKNNDRNSKVSDGVSLFRFPSNPSRRAEWVTIVKIDREEPFYKAAKSSVICSNHFDETDMTGNAKRRRLVKTAIPTLQITSQSSTSPSCRSSSSITKRDLEAEVDQEFEAGDQIDDDGDDVDDFDDLLLFKNNSAANGKASYSKPVHRGVTCTHCQKEIAGHRYMCLQCADCNLCSTCESSGLHPHHCMLRLPCPTVYESVAPFLETLKFALNTNSAVPENVPRPDNYIIKQEPKAEPLIETDDHNTVPTADPLAEPKPEIDEESVTTEEHVHLDDNVTETKHSFYNNNPAHDLVDIKLPSTSRDTSTSKTSCITGTEPAQHQQPSKHKLERKISNPGISETSAGTRVKDNRMGADGTRKEKRDRKDDRDQDPSESVQLSYIKLETEELDTGGTFTEYGSHR